MGKTNKGWEDCSEGNTNQMHLSLQKRSSPGLVPNIITGGETGSGAIALQKLNPPCEFKREIIIDCTGTGMKPWRETGRSTFNRAGLEKSSPPAFFILSLKGMLPTNSCVCSFRTYPSRVNSPWSRHWGTDGKMRSGGENHEKKQHTQMELHSYFLHLLSDTQVFLLMFESRCGWCSGTVHYACSPLTSVS